MKGINIVKHLLCARQQPDRYYHDDANFSEWEKKPKLRRIEKPKKSDVTSKAAKMELK